MDEVEYGDVHRIVLQGLMSAGFLDAKGVKKLFLGACTFLKLNAAERTTMPYVQKVVREINDRIKKFDMAIRSASCELSGKKYYIFLVTVEKQIMRLQTLFSKFELELFQKTMHKILRGHDTFSARMCDCVNMARELQAKGTIQQADKFILRMINENYLARYYKTNEKDEDDFEITLGIRGIRELEPILREVYADVMGECSLCKMLLLHGYACPQCKVLVHKACYDRFDQSNNNKCPNCKESWADETRMLRRVREREDGTEDSSDDGGAGAARFFGTATNDSD